MAPHSSTLAWKIPWTEEPGRLQFMGSRRVGHDWATSLSLFTFLHWRRKWQPTPVFLPGESQGRGSLVGCRLWGRTRLKWLSSSSSRQQDRTKPTEGLPRPARASPPPPVNLPYKGESGTQEKAPCPWEGAERRAGSQHRPLAPPPSPGCSRGMSENLSLTLGATPNTTAGPALWRGWGSPAWSLSSGQSAILTLTWWPGQHPEWTKDRVCTAETLPERDCPEAELRKQPECPTEGNNEIKQGVIASWDTRKSPHRTAAASS